MMKIASITTWPVRLAEGDFFGGKGGGAAPVASDYFVQPGWRGIYSSRIETLLVRIETECGLVGFGEGQSPIAPEVAATVVEHILRPVLLGRDPAAVEVRRHELYELMNVRGHFTGFMLDAISAVDIALWDIKGKSLGVPVCALLGGPFRDRLPAYVSGIRGETVEDKVATIRAFQARGFSTFKYFGGFGVAEDVAVLQAIRESVGPEVALAADNLWRYDINGALELGRRLEQLRFAWYEAPTDPEDVDGNALLAQTLDLPIANGETERTRYQFLPWFQKRALDIAQPDIGRCGISEGRKIVELAETFHIPCMLHMGMGSPVMLAASLHVAAAAANVRAVEYQPVVVEAMNRMVKTGLVCDGGVFHLPAGPGLGVEVDEAALQRAVAPRPA